MYRPVTSAASIQDSHPKGKKGGEPRSKKSTTNKKLCFYKVYFFDKNIKITLTAFSNFLHTTFLHYLGTSCFTYEPAESFAIFTIIHTAIFNFDSYRANSKP
ncbi:MAG: hypothetical protein D3910_12965 [Candidatus Electrothrix sp. ATG2]|nr:hypothetical protein [Candidatus Electrothrix sp. ATG2]